MHLGHIRYPQQKLKLCVDNGVPGLGEHYVEFGNRTKNNVSFVARNTCGEVPGTGYRVSGTRYRVPGRRFGSGSRPGQLRVIKSFNRLFSPRNAQRTFKKNRSHFDSEKNLR